MEIHWIFQAIAMLTAIFTPIYLLIKYMLKKLDATIAEHKAKTANQPIKNESQIIAEKIDGLTVLIFIMVFISLCSKF